MMKKLIPIIAVLVVAIGIAAYLAVSLHIKRKYDKARIELADHVLSAVPMDAETKVLLTEVRTGWVEKNNEVGGPHSDALKTIGLEPSVSNVIELLTYRMPEYSLLSLRRNSRPMQIGAIQAVLLPISIDKSIHVSDDRHVALIRIHPAIVYVFTDEAGGLRETQYWLKKENIEPTAEGDAADHGLTPTTTTMTTIWIWSFAHTTGGTPVQQRTPSLSKHLMPP